LPLNIGQFLLIENLAYVSRVSPSGA